jgi:uncharacterized protein YjbI with pentapeptide repeats
MATSFDREDLSGARFEECEFTGAVFHNSYFIDAKLRGAWLERVDIGLPEFCVRSQPDIGCQ